MKGNISIGDFIRQVKSELQEAQSQPRDAFFELEDVTLEISFVLDIEGGAKMNLYVVEIGGKSKAAQTHKVTLKFKPFDESTDDVQVIEEPAAVDPEKRAPRVAARSKGGRKLYAPKRNP